MVTKTQAEKSFVAVSPPSEPTPSVSNTPVELTPAEVRLILAFAEVATPAGRYVRGPDDTLAGEVARALASMGARFAAEYPKLLHALDLAAVPLTGRRLAKLPTQARAAALQRLNDNALTHLLVRGVTTPIKLAAVLREDMPEALGANVGVSALRVVPEVQRWRSQLVDARTLPDGETMEVDAVVVGSGAGGAPVALSLASRGHAVVVLEAGANFERSDFHGHAWQRGLQMMTQHFTLGNTSVLLPVGRTVGGTTTVNSGTCFPTPHEVLRRWRFEDGLTELDPASLAPFLARVQAQLGVALAEASTLGGVGRVVARGAEKLGWHHGPLPRNAPGCDGQGLCCFGCPTDAKRSTNVSYLPAAMSAGALVVHHARVEEILMAGGRAVGVVARAGDRGPRLRILARNVVLAAGTLGTAALLLKQGLANSSGQVGKNLTIHPASNAWAEFDERIEGWRGIPQGYGIDSFLDEGIRFEGAFVPLDVAASTHPEVGAAWTHFVERFDHMASFGFMLADTSRGRVVLGPGGRPHVLYRVNDTDRRRFLRGQSLLARLFLAAGARTVWTAVRGHTPITTETQAEALEHETGGPIPARRMELSAYHPLGTCRMGRDASRSVVGPDHETHDVPGLFVVDGSCVNGPLGVNPQITIMTLAERAGVLIAERLEATAAPSGTRASAARTQPPQVRPGIEFAETMKGTCTLLRDQRVVDARFTVRATAPRAGAAMRKLFTPSGAAFELRGLTDVDGLATASPCVGTLHMRPLRTRGTLVYSLDFRGDDGVDYRLYGEKNVHWKTLLTGMTTLATEIARVDDGVPIARGTLVFALSELAPFLATWRVRRLAAPG